MSRDNKDLVVGLDIGTHKICTIVAEMTEEGRLDVIGIGQAESKGLRKGVVINLEATVDSIKRVVEEAELMAGVEIGSAYVGIAGTHIRGFNSRGVIAVSGKNRVIEREDERMRKRYVASTRHTIQVDFYPYMRTIARERRRRRRRGVRGAVAGRSHELRLPTPAG